MSFSRITLFVVTLAASATFLIAAAPAETQADRVATITGPDAPLLSADGKAVYMKKYKKCHGADGKAQTKMGKKYEMKPIPGSLNKGKVVSVVKNGKANTKMKSFKDKLSAEEIDAVAAYVMTL